MMKDDGGNGGKTTENGNNYTFTALRNWKGVIPVFCLKNLVKYELSSKCN